MRSTTHRNAPPSRNPTVAGIQPGTPLPSDIAMAGASSDQKLAAIITPAAKPSMAFSRERLTLLVRKTVAAPAAVMPQVKMVARSAWIMGLSVANVDISTPPGDD